MVSTRDINIIQSRQNGTPLEVKLMIHHEFPGIELVSPVYAGCGAICHLSLDQGIDVGSTMQVGFKIDLTQEESIGTLMYRLKRKNTDQSDEEETCIQLVIIWKVNNVRDFCAFSLLIEHDKSCIWDENKLLKLAKHYKLANIQHGLIETTWLIHDNTVLMAKVDATREEESYKLEMTVSEEGIEDDTQRPVYIDLDR
jgi:hypothetical protein